VRSKQSLSRILKEQPLRVPTQFLVKRLPFPLRTKVLFDAVPRPQYYFGVLEAADQALRQELSAISIVEFGVAAGHGLLDLQQAAEDIEAETGVRIEVYGFDAGGGMPELVGDHRDHPDVWKRGDYPMDQGKLRAQLLPRTRLILGEVRDTLAAFIEEGVYAPVGFVSYDLDLYSSTRDAFALLSSADRNLLRRVILYFDDIHMWFTHRFAGELLAIREFNEQVSDVKIDVLHSVPYGRPFRESWWVGNIYCAHDLRAIDGFEAQRASDTMTFRL
jgi:hypothetical protein